jgi:hypothetical protein
MYLNIEGESVDVIISGDVAKDGLSIPRDIKARGVESDILPGSIVEREDELRAVGTEFVLFVGFVAAMVIVGVYDCDAEGCN